MGLRAAHRARRGLVLRHARRPRRPARARGCSRSCRTSPAGVDAALRTRPPLDGAQLYGNIGADLKLGLTSALTLDATINPDFGQVEADQVVLNLTTFEVFFPEKRPFFLEGVEHVRHAAPAVLLAPHRPRAARRRRSAADERSAQPLPDGRIWAAAKLTGLVAPRLTIGALDALTAAQIADGRRRGSARRAHARLVEPLTNFAVLRLKREILGQLVRRRHGHRGQPLRAAPAPPRPTPG